MRHILIFLLTLFIISCTQSKTEDYTTEKINNSTFLFKTVDQRLVDTLKQKNIDNKLILFQIWDKGQLKETSIIDENGKTRRLKYYSNTNEETTTTYFVDINDDNFKIFPFNKDIFQFYENHLILSDYSVTNDSLTEIDIFNYPIELSMFAATNGMIKFQSNKLQLKPSSSVGDTMRLLIYNPLTGKSDKEINLLIN